MGSDRLANEVAAVKQHQQRHSALVRVVDAQWLRACSASCGRADEDVYVLGLAALMPSTNAHGRELGPEQGNRGSSRGAWDGEPCHAMPLHPSFCFPCWQCFQFGLQREVLVSTYRHLTDAAQIIERPGQSACQGSTSWKPRPTC